MTDPISKRSSITISLAISLVMISCGIVSAYYLFDTKIRETYLPKTYAATIDKRLDAFASLVLEPHEYNVYQKLIRASE